MPCFEFLGKVVQYKLVKEKIRVRKDTKDRKTFGNSENVKGNLNSQRWKWMIID